MLGLLRGLPFSRMWNGANLGIRKEQVVKSDRQARTGWRSSGGSLDSSGNGIRRADGGRMAESLVTRGRGEVFARLKTLVPRQVLAASDMNRIGRLSEEELRREFRFAVARLIAAQSLQLSSDEVEILVQEVLNELFGLGPLEPLMHDPDVSDILVNGAHHVYVEREGQLHATDITFPDNEYLTEFVKRIVSRMDRRIDESSPMVDVSLPDGSRLNAVIPPLSLRGPTLSIRRFRPDPILLEEMVRLETMTSEMAEFLAKVTQARINVLISGATGVGKSTLLNALGRFISPAERVITIEHTAELQMLQPEIVSLEARPPNIEGKGEILVRDLIKNALRMRPDRIIVGECRGTEVFDVLQAMLSGHDGSMTTIHANDAREALHRVEMMIALAGLDLPRRASRQYVASAIQLVIHLKRLNTGERKVMKISELVGTRDEDFHIEDVFSYQQRGVNRYGKAVGHFQATGYRPTLLAQMEAMGLQCRPEIFAAREHLPVDGNHS